MQNNRFKRGQGAFPCAVCHRLTRDVNGNGSVELCPECYEVAGIENQINDEGDPDGKLQQEIDRLNAIVRQKGGKL